MMRQYTFIFLLAVHIFSILVTGHADTENLCYVSSNEPGVCTLPELCSAYPTTLRTLSSNETAYSHQKDSRNDQEHDSGVHQCASPKICCPTGTHSILFPSENTENSQSTDYEDDVEESMEEGMNCDEQAENCSEYVNLDNEHASNFNSSEHNVTDTLSTRGNFTNATELSTRFGSHDFEGNPWGFPSGFSFGSPFPIPQQTEFVQFETPVEDLKPLYLNSNVGNARNILPAFCGLIDPGLRIFGGSEPSDGEIPWMVALIYSSPTGLRQECGGSLITDRHVLTAAHCILSMDMPEEWILISVRIGSRNIGFNEDCSRQNERPWAPKRKCAPEYVDIPIAKKIVHEAYEVLIPRNDIALLVLSKSVTFTDTVRPICLPDSPRVSQKLTTAGWGRTETQAKSQTLLKVEIPLANKQRCDAVYENKGWRLISTQICAGGEPGKDSCLGDSGGPLMDIHNLELSTYCIVGVTSSGPRSCGSPDFPAIYTKVYDFVPWILEKIQSTRNVVKSARLTSNKKRPRPQIQRKQGPQRQQQYQSVRDRSKSRQTGPTIDDIDIRKQSKKN